MSKIKYYYGLIGIEIYYENNIEDFINNYPNIKKGQIIIEMKPDQKELKYCGLDSEIWEPQCGYDKCELIKYYKPRNGKNGICKYLQCGLSETGRKWEVLKDDPEAIKDFKKISGRYKK